MERIINWGIALTAAIFVTSAQAQTPSAIDLQAIDEVAAEAIAARAMPGLAIAIRRPDGTIISRAYGLEKTETEEAVDDNSAFRLGSISKLVTSAVVMKLVEDGKLSLDQPVRDLLDGKYGWSNFIPASVTLEHLLNHTSGLPDYTREELEDGVTAGFFDRDRLEEVLQRPSENRAGNAWVYSDANYSLVSVIVEHVTGLSYDDYIGEVFAPALALRSLQACDTYQAHKVTGYLSSQSGFVPEPAYEVRGLLGSGGLCSTVQDLVNIPARLIESRWIKPESLERMLERTELQSGIIVDYGLGVRGGFLGDNDAWGHTGGGLHGAWATLAHYTTSGYSIAVVANGTGSELDASVIHARIAQIVLKPSELDDLRLSEAELALLSGAYTRGSNVSCIFVSDGRLYRRRAHGDAPAVPLMAQDKLTFGRSDYPLDRIVFQASDGPSQAFLIYYDGLFAEYWVRQDPTASEWVCDGPRDLN
ncbi:serine hydrolase domain-containing protein [Qipengyuania mesophila]|uniref:serine hydrolase domain-containing protein n=1 Tax=Qipengyuania mesophila TaxID=2867246 RepID=UPI00351201D6